MEGAEADPTNKGANGKVYCGGAKQPTVSTQKGGANANSAAKSSNKGGPAPGNTPSTTGSSKSDVTPKQNGGSSSSTAAAKETTKAAIAKGVTKKIGSIAAIPFTMSGSQTYPEKVKHATKSAMGRANAGYDHITLEHPDYNDDIIGDAERDGYDYITLYRGVNVEHGRYPESEKGFAVPNYIPSFTNLWGWIGQSPATPQEHNSKQGATRYSPYTSWTTDKEVAISYAVTPQISGKGTRGIMQRYGVVQTIVVKRSEAIKTERNKDIITFHTGQMRSEAEYLLKGVKIAHKVEKINYSSTVTK